MTLKIAKRLIIVMIAISIAIAVLNTFFDQDYIGALIGVSAASAFYFLHRNPELMLAKNWDEFGELYDKSRDKKYIWGFPAYNAVMLLVIFYIWIA